MYLLNTRSIDDINISLHYRNNKYTQFGDFQHYDLITKYEEDVHFFQVNLYMNTKKILFFQFDLDGYIVSIELAEPARKNTICILRRNYNGIIYLFSKNNLNLFQETIDFYTDYYNNSVVINDRKSKVIIDEVYTIISHIRNIEESKCYFDILTKILCLSKEVYFDDSYYLKQGYISPLSVLPPNVRPDINHNYIIVQVTSGCGLIKRRKKACAFCDSFNSNYVEREVNEISNHIACLKKTNTYALGHAKYVFLADGDPLIAHNIIDYITIIKNKLPRIEGFESFVSTATILNCNEKRWKEFMGLGLKKVYWGVESADDDTLKIIDKPHNQLMLLQAKEKLEKIGIHYDIIIMSGIAKLDKLMRTKDEVINNAHIQKTCEFVNNSKCDSVFISKLEITIGSKLFKQKDRYIFPYSSDEMEAQYRMLVGSLRCPVRGSYGNQFIVKKEDS